MVYDVVIRAKTKSFSESTGGSTTGDDEESSDAAGAFNASNITASVGGITLTAETRKNTLQVRSLSEGKSSLKIDQF
jgi:hypothetical protein